MYKFVLAGVFGLAILGLMSPALADPLTQPREGFGLTADQPEKTRDALICRASKVIGVTVTNTEGEELGTIENLAVCPKTSRVSHAIISSGGLMGVGKTLRPVPWQVFEVLRLQPQREGEQAGTLGAAQTSPTETPEQHRMRRTARQETLADAIQIRLALSKDRFENAPQVKETEVSKCDNKEFLTQLDEYYNVKSTRPEMPRETKQAEQYAKPGVQKVDDLIGMVVKNDAGNEVGKCKDLVFDARTGQVRYLALSFATLGERDKLFAVPLESITFSHDPNQPQDTYLMSSINASELKNRQGFGEDKWPSMASERWPLRR